jgi:hypothetical protein
MIEFEKAFDELAAWCRARDYAGSDPFDALNSSVFQATPLRHSRLARLAWTQLFKRSPVNLRLLAGVPAGRNAKGTALFALAWLSRLRAARAEGDGPLAARAEAEARSLLDGLLDAHVGTRSGGAAWGYNFDWQGRTFYAPRGTPTIVPTAFAARAFLEASQVFGEAAYLEVARAACRFVLEDLPRVGRDGGDEVCFGYVPQTPTRIFNASLLAGEMLGAVGRATGERELCEYALRSARYVARRQRDDGVWAYGEEPYQSWVDNFHTAFVLLSLERIRGDCCAGSDAEAGDGIDAALRRGYDFWLKNFFLADGWPKYYEDNPYPADIHSSAAAVVALCGLGRIDPDARAHAGRIARWAVENLRDPQGFFYYQRRRRRTVSTPHMRWAQGWMLYALARLIEPGGGASRT